MCGIAGFVGAFDRELLQRMSALIAHRGPDDAGTWVDTAASVGLAHRRLAIIDLRPEAHQPMANEDDTLWVIFNGEIYNFPDLRAELVAKGHRFKSRSDTEILLHLYEEEGADMLARLNGMFAFALWDTRRRELLLARDGFGVKPLYYAEIAQGFLFASELKALLAEPSLPRDVDFEALHYYLAFFWAPAPFTMLKAVRKLEPGEAMIIRDGRIARRWSFYDLPYDGRRTDAPAANLAQDLRTHLGTAVARQMISDVPVGAMLSGGLDSSAIVAFAAESGQRIPCYSIGFEGTDLDGSPADLPFARRVTDHLGLELREIRVTPDIIQNLEQMIWHLDEPEGDPAPINVILIAEAARRDGVKVLLSGAGGDDLFSGYRRHMALGYERWWAWLPQRLRRRIAAWAQQAAVGTTLRRRLAKTLTYADASADERLCGYFDWTNEPLRRGLYTPALQNQVAGTETLAPLKASLARIPHEPDRLNRMLYLEARHFLADHNLNYTDKASMAHGIEVRVPFLDPDLVRFATTVPSAWKQRGAVGKAIFKRAMEPALPRDVIYRPKTGFGVPLRRWLRHELRETVRETLSPERLKARGWFDPVAVGALVQNTDDGRVDGSYLVFALLCVEVWCKLFLDQGGARAGGVPG